MCLETWKGQGSRCPSEELYNTVGGRLLATESTWPRTTKRLFCRRFRKKPAREQFRLWRLYTVFLKTLYNMAWTSFSVISVIVHCLLGLLLTDSKFSENKYCLNYILRVWHLQITSFARLAPMPATEEKRGAGAGESGNSLSNTAKLPSQQTLSRQKMGWKKGDLEGSTQRAQQPVRRRAASASWRRYITTWLLSVQHCAW